MLQVIISYKKTKPGMRKINVRSIDDACMTVEDFIEQNGLLASTFGNGQVYSEQGEYLGCVSYNGRFWDKEHKYGKEIFAR